MLVHFTNISIDSYAITAIVDESSDRRIQTYVHTACGSFAVYETYQVVRDKIVAAQKEDESRRIT